jgi:drug/metabolite transporter (DMT)-like permease
VTRGLFTGLLMGLIAALIWGGQAVFARTGVLQGFGTFDLAALRYGAAALVLAPFAWTARREILTMGPGRLLALAATGGAPNALLFIWAMQYAPASHGGSIAPTTVAIMGVVLAIPLLGEWPTRGRTVALAVIAAGVLLIGWDGLAGAHPGAWRGDLILVAAGSTWAAFTLLLRRWRVPALPATATIAMISAAAVVPPWWIAGAGAVPFLPWEWAVWQGFGQGVLSSVVATLLYARAVERLGGPRAASVAAMVPVCTLALAGTLLGEHIGLLQLAGVALAVGGMLSAVLFTGRVST